MSYIKDGGAWLSEKYLNITRSGALNGSRFHGALVNLPEPNVQSVSTGGFANGIYGTLPNPIMVKPIHEAPACIRLFRAGQGDK
jgi:hypothetical protein